MKIQNIKAEVRDADGKQFSVEVRIHDDTGYLLQTPTIILWRDGAAATAHKVTVTTIR